MYSRLPSWDKHSASLASWEWTYLWVPGGFWETSLLGSSTLSSIWEGLESGWPHQYKCDSHQINILNTKYILKG